MTIRDFADHLGVSHRMVSKWEAGGEHIHPRPLNQSALDTSLARSDQGAQARFAAFADTSALSVVAGQSERPSRVVVRHPGDGKLMALVDAGVYLHGSGKTAVRLAAFYIDVHPVTNADYARFVEITGHQPPTHWSYGQCLDEVADHPVVFVTWSDAEAYTGWAGKQLPSAQQWEKAARGPHGSVYPWGDQPTPAKCNTRDSGPGTTTPVDRYQSGASLYGVYDLCGNVWEWCSTPTTPGRHELKGSAFTSGFQRATPSNFNDANATMLDDDTGFRCVIDADAMNTLQSA